jgi:hypothetical protein
VVAVGPPPECGVIGHRQHCWGSSAFVSVLCVAADGDLLLAVSLAGFRFTVIGWVATCFFIGQLSLFLVGLKVQQWVRRVGVLICKLFTSSFYCHPVLFTEFCTFLKACMMIYGNVT